MLRYKLLFQFRITDKEGNYYICRTCNNYLKRNKTPPQAFWNKMELDDDETCLSDLTNFEARIVSLRIPFMKVMIFRLLHKKSIS